MTTEQSADIPWAFTCLMVAAYFAIVWLLGPVR